MLAQSYARHVPAHLRVGQFVADQLPLGFIFPFLHEFPQSDIFVVGGTARDAILGRVPNGIHLVIHGVPQEIVREWTHAKHVPRSLDIKLPTSNTWDYSEHQLIAESHHTLPIVHDLARRDATVNAMAYSVREGLLHDPFDGLRDLEQETLRTIGHPDKHFYEDPSRMTRFLRLASELGFSIEDKAWQAINKHAKSLNRLRSNDDGKALFTIPRSHLGCDFIRALTKNPAKAFEHFVKSGVLHEIAPEFDELEKLETISGIRAQTRAVETLEYLAERHASPAIMLAALLSFFESGARQTLEHLNNRLHLPLIHESYLKFDELLWLLEHRHALDENNPTELTHGEFERLFGGKRGDDLLLLLEAILVTTKHYSIARERLYAAKRRKETFDDSAPKLLHGRDLLSLGLMPGPHLRTILHKIRNAQLEGLVESRLDALEFARKLVGAM